MVILWVNFQVWWLTLHPRISRQAEYGSCTRWCDHNLVGHWACLRRVMAEWLAHWSLLWVTKGISEMQGMQVWKYDVKAAGPDNISVNVMRQCPDLDKHQRQCDETMPRPRLTIPLHFQPVQTDRAHTSRLARCKHYSPLQEGPQN